MTPQTVLEIEVGKAERRHGHLLVTVDGAVPNVSVRGDELLSSVFDNLLSDAVRHTEGSEPRATIRVEEDETDVRVHVADNGPGIPEANIEGIFEVRWVPRAPERGLVSI